MNSLSNDPYGSWARTLLDRFFGLHMSGQRARLAVTRSLLDEDYPHLGGSAGFLECVRRGPNVCSAPHHGAAMIHTHALHLYRMWRLPLERRPERCFTLPDDAPLYLPHLAALCIGWTVNPDDEDLPSNAFYERLETILPGHSMGTVQLSQWRKLWDGLEAWTQRLTGKRGIFEVEILGSFVHVGIPLSQVLLTPRKVANLPELFVNTGLADLWKSADASQVRHILVDNESRTRSALGGLVFREIRDENSAIGKSALERLLEYLGDSKFREWSPDGINLNAVRSAPEGCAKSLLRVRLVLERIELPDGWKCCFGVLGEQPPDASTKTSGWSFIKVAEHLGGLWLASNEHSSGMPIDAAEWGDSLQRGLSIDYPPSLGQDQDEIELRLLGRGIRVFHETSWIGPMLVEDDCLPSTGGCFVLVMESALEEFSKWENRFRERGGTVSNFTLMGLPSGASIFHINSVEYAGDQLIKEFPETSFSRSKTKP